MKLFKNCVLCCVVFCFVLSLIQSDNSSEICPHMLEKQGEASSTQEVKSSGQQPKYQRCWSLREAEELTAHFTLAGLAG